MLKFSPKQLSAVLDSYAKEQFTGIVQVDVNLSDLPQKRSRLVVFEKGAITYAGLNLPKAQALVEQMGKYLQRNNIAAAISLANKKSDDHANICEYFQLFFRLGIFKWDEFQQFMQNNIIWTLEQVLPYGGTATIASQEQSVLEYLRDLPQLHWLKLASVLDHRQQEWLQLQPLVTSLETVPRCTPGAIATITNQSIVVHLRQSVDGLHSLTQIAYTLNQDPLRLAQAYYQWIEKGWLICEDRQQAWRPQSVMSNQRHLPTVLSVDDSPVVQMMIKRSISDHYRVLLANNAVDALNLLNRDPVSLLLLDVTMPDIDGLELCRTLRSIGKFRDLPVIMLTAKDGMMDKVKGRIAGSTYYLTKPVNREKLLETMQKCMAASAFLQSNYQLQDLQYAA